MIAPGRDELAHVTSLQVYMGVTDYGHLTRARVLLARMPALRGLDLELEDCDFLDNGECCDSAVWLVANMFRSRNEIWQPARLKSLRITSMCLSHVAMHLGELLNLDKLEHLQLIRCTDAEPFLRILEPLGLNLSTLCIKDSAWSEITDFATRDFLQSLRTPKTLKHLTMKFYEHWTFDERTLLSRSSSLEFLCIEDILWTQAVLPPSEHGRTGENLFVTVSIKSLKFTIILFPIFH